MKSPVAKHMNTFNKGSIIPHKKLSMKQTTELSDMQKEALEELVGSLSYEEYLKLDLDMYKDSCENCMNCVSCSSIEIEEE